MKPSNKILLRFVAVGIAGTIATGIIALIFKFLDWGPISQSSVSIPWIVAAILMIPAAYKNGFIDGSNQASKSIDDPPTQI